MKRVLGYLKSTVLAGVFFVLPFFFIVYILTEAVDILLAVATPVAEKLPFDFAGENEAKVIAVLILVLASFLIGMVVQTRTGSSAGSWLESRILNRVPGFSLFRTLSGQVAGTEEEQSQFAPAVLRTGPDTLTLAYIIEQHDNDYSTMLIPISPGGTTGRLEYVPSHRVTKLNVSLAKVFTCINNYGIGSGPIFKSHTPEKSV
jgi:uncharacterized membrane protein